MAKVDGKISIERRLPRMAKYLLGQHNSMKKELEEPVPVRSTSLVSGEFDGVEAISHASN